MAIRGHVPWVFAGDLARDQLHRLRIVTMLGLILLDSNSLLTDIDLVGYLGGIRRRTEGEFAIFAKRTSPTMIGLACGNTYGELALFQILDEATKNL
jgi:hypothetical protein